MEILRLHLGEAESKQTRFAAPVHGFVIKHPQAGAILVDTGIGSETERLRDWRLVTVQAGVALAEHGLHPTDVKLVVNTHLHFDHCGQNIVFRHAPFYVQRGELERARAEETAVHDWFDFAGARFELLEGDAEVQLMIGDAAYNHRIYHRYGELDPAIVPGQAEDPGSWRKSLQRVHDLQPAAVHFCHDTEVVRA
ncbi:MAG: MBL fold metallo-hydrolase [Chloroflexi bacterium]|nr:MAG: MBL fold metallo-hydrolase [Chloroflexota bacterium]